MGLSFLTLVIQRSKLGEGEGQRRRSKKAASLVDLGLRYSNPPKPVCIVRAHRFTDGYLRV